MAGMHTLDPAPLIRLAYLLAGPCRIDSQNRVRKTGPVQAAAAIGVSDRQFVRWSREGSRISTWKADEIVTGYLGLHPALVFPDWCVETDTIADEGDGGSER